MEITVTSEDLMETMVTSEDLMETMVTSQDLMATVVTSQELMVTTVTSRDIHSAVCRPPPCFGFAYRDVTIPVKAIYFQELQAASVITPRLKHSSCGNCRDGVEDYFSRTRKPTLHVDSIEVNAKGLKCSCIYTRTSRILICVFVCVCVWGGGGVGVWV